MCSLPWVQCKRWIPIGSMGCVHTNQKIPRNERSGSLTIFEILWKKLGKII
jgi:hypothetical protein